MNVIRLDRDSFLTDALTLVVQHIGGSVTKFSSFWADLDLRGALDEILPDWLKPKTYWEIRKSVLDRPRHAVGNRRKYVYRYAIFCATAPYAVASLLIWTADFTHIVPPDALEKHLADIKSQERELIELMAESRLFCERLTTANAPGEKRCLDTTRRMSDGFQKDIDRMQKEAKAFSTLKTSLTSSSLLAIASLLGAYIFAKVWLRFYPAHVQTTTDDIRYIARAYLLVMSTTMLIPNCIGATVFFITEILGRLDASAAVMLSSWLVVVGILPFAVCGVLGSYRLNDVLLSSHSWRIGRTWLVFLISNLLATIIFVPVFVVLFIVIFLQSGAWG